MASLAQIRAGIKQVVEAEQLGLKVYPRIPGTTVGRACVIRPAVTDFTVVMGKGLDVWHLDLVVLLAADGAVDVAQQHLDDYIDGGGPKSIRAAIFANKNLGLDDGTSANVAGMRDYGPFDFASYDHIGAILRLVVSTSPAR